MKKRHVFIIGSKSIGQYGGFESFVAGLIEHRDEQDGICYHIACKANGIGCMDVTKLDGVHLVRHNSKQGISDYRYKNVHLFLISCPEIGAATAILYDIRAMKAAIAYCRATRITRPVFYVLACRIGIIIKRFAGDIHQIGGELVVNPDGHEWKRAKWPLPVKVYWRWSEKRMVKSADTVVCDSVHIKRYINAVYPNTSKKTRYISYACDVDKSTLRDNDASFMDWLSENQVSRGMYYLVVGRMVPENNYETIIREFSKSHSAKHLVFITNENREFYKHLKRIIDFYNCDNVRFAGSVYDQELLKKIRENAYAYIHGHEVGGTNPSLLEAMASTRMNLLLDVGFNREVGRNAVMYWTKENGSLSNLIDDVDNMECSLCDSYGKRAKERIERYYNWDIVTKRYTDLWNSE